MDWLYSLIFGNIIFPQTLINKAFGFVEDIQLSLYINCVLITNCHMCMNINLLCVTWDLKKITLFGCENFRLTRTTQKAQVRHGFLVD